MRTILSLLAFVAVLSVPSVHAATTTSGTVDSSDPAQITVAGNRYAIDADTELLDRGGHRIPVTEIVPGTAVELEIGDDANLVSVRANLVR